MKKLIERRALLVFEAKELIDNADTESRDLNKVEGMQYDSILNEVEKLSKEIDDEIIALGRVARSRKDYSNKANFQDLLDDLEKPTSRAIKPQGQFVSDDPEMRIYDKNSLPELRSRLTGGKSLSLGRVMRGAITGDTKNCTREERDAIGRGVGGGQFLIAEELSGILIPMALNKSRVMSSGARFIPMKESSLLIPKLIKLPDTEFKKENIKFAGDTKAINFDGELLVAKTLVSICKLSMELALDGHNIENTIESAMSSAVSLALDKACLTGSGTYPEPRGIANNSAVQEEDCALTIENYDHFSNAFYKIENENGTPTNMISPSSLLATVDLLKDKDDNPLTPPESWIKLRKLSSNQLTNVAIMGGFENLLIGMRTQATLDITKVAGDSFEKMQVWLRIYLRFDLALGIENHFCVLKNFTEVAS